MSRKALYDDLAKIAWADANALEFPRYQPCDEKPIDPERLKRCHPALVAAAGEARREKELLERRSAEAPYLRELSRCLRAEKPSKALLEAQKEAMGDEEFLGYVLAHSQTEKALFSMAHARRLFTLAGREDEAKACDGSGFVSIFYPTAKTLVEAAKFRLFLEKTRSEFLAEQGDPRWIDQYTVRSISTDEEKAAGVVKLSLSMRLTKKGQSDGQAQ